MAMKATEILEEEHRVIQSMAASLAMVGEDLEKGKTVPTNTLRILSQFLDIFVMRCHHRKEEAYLFTVLQTKRVPTTGCPLAVLHDEHAKVQTLVSQFADSVEQYAATSGEARASLGKTIHGLLALLPGHIWKEDYLLLPMADKLLSPQEQESLVSQFEQVESELGPGIHHGFERLAEDLEEVVRRQ